VKDKWLHLPVQQANKLNIPSGLAIVVNCTAIRRPWSANKSTVIKCRKQSRRCNYGPDRVASTFVPQDAVPRSLTTLELIPLRAIGGAYFGLFRSRRSAIPRRYPQAPRRQPAVVKYDVARGRCMGWTPSVHWCRETGCSVSRSLTVGWDSWDIAALQMTLANPLVLQIYEDFLRMKNMKIRRLRLRFALSAPLCGFVHWVQNHDSCQLAYCSPSCLLVSASSPHTQSSISETDLTLWVYLFA
jgi:hypothetical protein